jgi:hypothetical protein
MSELKIIPVTIERYYELVDNGEIDETAFYKIVDDEELKKKPRMTCKKYCPVWNDIDKDCEIYGEHHFTPRTCPHYNKELKDE